MKFVVESASPTTVSAARAQLGDTRFSLIVVPRCRPYTKPKALNYALPLARGEHVVVFDAEDLPHPRQLRTAASLFAEDPTLECLQGELVIANASRNWITRMFAAEYAGHFGVLLPAIGRAGFPVPLGGTSNHFRTTTLKDIGAWDAFNVTEDADLGIRMARMGLRVESLASVTLEEAPETVAGWVRQRSRWIKGWMQTLLVHSARPGKLLADLGWANLIAFYIFVGGMVLSLSVHGLFLIGTIARLLYDILVVGTPDLWTVAGLGTLLLGYSGAIVISVIGLDRIGRKDIAPLAGCPAGLLGHGVVFGGDGGVRSGLPSLPLVQDQPQRNGCCPTGPGTAPHRRGAYANLPIAAHPLACSQSGEWCKGSEQRESVWTRRPDGTI
ncbi:MAG: hypothetical protein CMJ15_09055 [Pelagibacterium sp.]|nr:hypothetical protein [Pelagibacterium sp.]